MAQGKSNFKSTPNYNAAKERYFLRNQDARRATMRLLGRAKREQ